MYIGIIQLMNISNLSYIIDIFPLFVRDEIFAKARSERENRILSIEHSFRK